MAAPPAWGNYEPGALPEAHAESAAYVAQLERRLAQRAHAALPRGARGADEASTLRALTHELAAANAAAQQRAGGAAPAETSCAPAGATGATEEAQARAALLGGEPDVAYEPLDTAAAPTGAAAATAVGAGAAAAARPAVAGADDTGADTGAGTGLGGGGGRPTRPRLASPPHRAAVHRGAAGGGPPGAFPFASAAAFCDALREDCIGALLQLCDGVSWMAARALGWAPRGGGGVAFTPLDGAGGYAAGRRGPRDGDDTAPAGAGELEAGESERDDAALCTPGAIADSAESRSDLGLRGPGRPAHP